MNKDLWGQIQEELQETIGKNNFTNWISPLKFSEVVDGVATFKVPTTFLGNYVSQNFGDIILFKLNSVDKSVTRISFIVSDSVLPKKSDAKSEVKFQSLPLIGLKLYLELLWTQGLLLIVLLLGNQMNWHMLRQEELRMALL